MSGGGEVEQSVVRREVVSVIDAGEVVEKGVLEERLAIDIVHDGIEDHEDACGNGNEEESFGVEEMQDCLKRRWICRNRGWGALESPEHAGAVYEWIDFEMNTDTEEKSGAGEMFSLESSQQSENQDTQ